MRYRPLPLLFLACLLVLPACGKKATSRAGQMQAILGGKSRVAEVESEGKTVKVGDTARVPEWDTVHVLDEDGEPARGIVEYGGSLEVLGFTDDRREVLVQYTPPKGSVGAEGAPEKTRFFLPVDKFVDWGQHFARIKPERGQLWSQAQKIRGGDGRRTATGPRSVTLKAGDMVLFQQPLTVEVFNEDPVPLGGQVLFFELDGAPRTWTAPKGQLVGIMGFTDDGKQGLVQLLPPSGVVSQTSMPPGIQFFTPVTTLAEWPKKQKPAR
jgi:hypothetical protein